MNDYKSIDKKCSMFQTTIYPSIHTSIHLSLQKSVYSTSQPSKEPTNHRTTKSKLNNDKKNVQYEKLICPSLCFIYFLFLFSSRYILVSVCFVLFLSKISVFFFIAQSQYQKLQQLYQNVFFFFCFQLLCEQKCDLLLALQRISYILPPKN